MSVLLFKLRGVPDDEADEVRELLEHNQIDFYETPPSRWGVSMEAIWLKDESQLSQAQQLIAEYQRQRYQSAQEEQQQLEAEGKGENLWSRFKEDPIQFIVFILLALLVIYLSTMPFLNLGN